MMSSWRELVPEDWWRYLTTETARDALRAAIILVIGLIVARLVSRAVARLIADRPLQVVQLLRRITFGLCLGIFLAAAVNQLGFRLGVVFGAAGVLTLAIGFASQTALSNLISGFFLITERPFNVGDVIRVGATTGTVLSVDTLSIKLRTFDNTFVRIPNESLIKAEVTTLTRYAMRRADLRLPIAFDADIGHAEELLREIASENPLCMEDPPPVFIVHGFLDSALDVQFSVWTLRENLLQVKTDVVRRALEQLPAAGIPIPLPQRSIRFVDDGTNFAVPDVPEP